MSIFKRSVRLCSQRVHYTERLKIVRVFAVIMIVHNIPIAYENIIYLLFILYANTKGC